MFPELKQKTFLVYWTDQDRDIITITDDEQLRIALTEMEGPLYKLSIKIKDTAETTKNTAVVHAGIVCDGC